MATNGDEELTKKNSQIVRQMRSVKREKQIANIGREREADEQRVERGRNDRRRHSGS